MGNLKTVESTKKEAPKKGGHKGAISACEELAKHLGSPVVARATVDGNISKISRLEGAMAVLRCLDSGKNVTLKNFCEVIGV